MTYVEKLANDVRIDIFFCRCNVPTTIEKAINSAMQEQREACASVSLAWHCVAVTSQDYAKYPELNYEDVHQAILHAEVKPLKEEVILL